MYYQLLEIVARSHPWLYEKLHPNVPRTAYSEQYATARALNPQPLPPHELFLVGAADLADEVARTTVAMEARGDAGANYLREIVDDWCGTPWPHKFPWPLTWPPNPDPDPNPWYADVRGGRVIAATVFASYGSRIRDDKISRVFAEASERLAEAAVGERQVVAKSAGKRTTRR